MARGQTTGKAAGKAARKSRWSKAPGPTFSEGGAIPGSSETSWNTANPSADATRPSTMPAAIASTMETDPAIEERPPIDEPDRGPDFSIAGAVPGSSETSWNTANPSADATRPSTMPRRLASSAPSDSMTKEELYRQARQRGIKGRSSMTKAQLRKALAR